MMIFLGNSSSWSPKSTLYKPINEAHSSTVLPPDLTALPNHHLIDTLQFTKKLWYEGKAQMVNFETPFQKWI